MSALFTLAWPGRTPLIVYLHGLGLAGSTDWPRVAAAPALAGRASLAVDLLGFGQSPRPREAGYDLTDQAERVAALLAADGRSVALVGHSMGGTLAVLLAELLVRSARAPEAVLLAEPNLRAEDATLSAQAAATPVERFLAEWPQWVARADAGYYRAGMELSDPLAFHRSATSLVRHSQALLPRFVALLVRRKGYVLGGRTGGATRQTAEQVARAGVPVVTVPGAGHAFCHDDPAGFAQAIAELLG